MKQEFNKQSFKSSQIKLLLTCVIIGLIGIASIICAFNVGDAIKFSFFDMGFSESSIPEIDDDFGDDPKDYYGDYYYVQDFVIAKVSISESGAVIDFQNPFLSAPETYSYSYRYASAKYASDKFEKDCPAILLFEGSTFSDKMFWLTKDESGAYVLADNADNVYSSKVITFEEINPDPKDYFGTYYAEENFVIETLNISETGATLDVGKTYFSDAASYSYKYIFVCGDYSEIINGTNCDALLFYEDDISKIVGTMWLKKDAEGNYTLTNTQNREYTKNKITWEGLINDPKDYYGAYYSEDNFLIGTMNLSADTVTFNVGNPYSPDLLSESYNYVFVCGDYSEIINGTNCDALLYYKDDIKEKFSTLWLKKDANGNYTVTEGEGIEYTKNEITWEGLMNDPKDYYGTYYAEDSFLISTLKITANGATLTLENPHLDQPTLVSYRCEFICGAYSEKQYDKNQNALLFYDNTDTLWRIIWLTKDDNGNYILTDNEGVEYTKNEITWEGLINDPKDYYGTYYGESDFVIQKLAIDENTVTITKIDPMKNDVTTNYKYFYAPAEYTEILHGVKKDALALYKESTADISYFIYISKDASENYKFENTSNVHYTAEEITFADLVDDPCDYYGHYAYSDINQLTLNEDGTAVFMLNGEEATYSYFYANYTWLSSKGVSYYPAIVLVDKGSGTNVLFKIDSTGDLWYGNQTLFEKQ